MPTPLTPPPLPADPFVTITQHGGELRLNSNLQGPQALPTIRQLLLQGADLVLVEVLKAELRGGPQQVVVAPGTLNGLLRR